MSVIYKIGFKNSDSFYIGSAINYENRRNSHLNSLRNKKHRNQHLQRIYDKYGEGQMFFEVLEIVDKQDTLLIREQFWIDKYDFNILINICPIAGNTFGRKHSQESKNKISKNHHNVDKENNPMFGKKGISNPNYNKVRSEQTKFKISKSLKGREPWNKGVKRPDHSKRMKGEGNPFFGKTHLEETKQKIKESSYLNKMLKGGKKLTIEIVREIREKYEKDNITITALAKEYNISRNYCSGLLKGEYWNE